MASVLAQSTHEAHQPGRSSSLRAVLFDLDGTLLDTAPDLIECAQVLLEEHDLPRQHEGHFGPVVSHGSAAILSRVFNIAPDDPAMEPLRQRFLALYREHVSSRTRPFPGMLEVLDDLEARGMIWGVVTNKPAWLTNPLMRDLGLAERSRCIVCGDTLAQRKPHPAPVLHACELIGVEPAETVFIGDALRDVDAGQRAGTKTLGALFGYICAEDKPWLWGADAYLNAPGDLSDWLDAMDRAEGN
ncbi:phosphoglycolate phosphatase [Natronocella acetinitrilica]|uniref:Phosphoglycolate phosphatase n=1 Tax=Natronocella acetinitrilica TaxID=414046 RepID=A0AAE3G5I3_9GAMM|nr:HAD-IA family hydrolase [Natronocella acetinitrilica]MCP1674788.1 phosphoglycolate phosphatase [Natronocella acetinitrilica]